jgi:YVTN family beta-propeller protein
VEDRCRLWITYCSPTNYYYVAAVSIAARTVMYPGYQYGLRCGSFLLQISRSQFRLRSMQILNNFWSRITRSTHATSVFVFFALASCLAQPIRAQQTSAHRKHPAATLPTNTVVANVSVGLDPSFAVVSPDSSTFYVANQMANTVSVIDAVTNTVTSSISVGNSPLGLALTPDGSTLYVANGGNDSISVVDTATNTVTVGSGPLLLAVSPDGKSLYVPCSTQIQIIDTANNQISNTVPVP